MTDVAIPAPAGKRLYRRRRFMMVATAGLTVLGVVLGLSFTADSGSTDIGTITGSSPTGLLYPVGNGNALPETTTTFIAATGGKLRFTPNANLATVGSHKTSITTATFPSWTPVKNSSGKITTGGDLGVINCAGTDAGYDTGAGSLTLNMYITNLKDLQAAYSSFAFPINVYYSSDSGVTWTQAATIAPANQGNGSPGVVSSTNAAVASSPGPGTWSYNTNTIGLTTFTLNTSTGTASCLYDITMDNTQGSFFTINANPTSPGTLTPRFYFTLGTN